MAGVGVDGGRHVSLPDFTDVISQAGSGLVPDEQGELGHDAMASPATDTPRMGRHGSVALDSAEPVALRVEHHRVAERAVVGFPEDSTAHQRDRPSPQADPHAYVAFGTCCDTLARSQTGT